MITQVDDVRASIPVICSSSDLASKKHRQDGLRLHSEMLLGRNEQTLREGNTVLIRISKQDRSEAQFQAVMTSVVKGGRHTLVATYRTAALHIRSTF